MIIKINCSPVAAGLLLVTAGLFTSCTPEPRHRRVEAAPLERPLLRFEQALFSRDTVTATGVDSLRSEFGLFFDMFCSRILRIVDTSDAARAGYLTQFVTDPDMRMLYLSADSMYRDFDGVHRRLNAAFGYHHHYFPGRPAPRFITCLSAFNYQVVTTDSILAVCLDMYLGENRQAMYASVGFPNYMSARFSEPYIAVDCMKGWFQSEFDVDSVPGDLLSRMVYYGRMLYFLDCMLPGAADTLKTGYTGEQLAWCRQNEANIWAHLIEQNLLFSTDPQVYFKYINDGPTTNGLPRESPARLGYWVGWKIVRAWAENNAGMPLDSLWFARDARSILNRSGYKPNR